MTSDEKEYFLSKMLTLRNAINELIGELESKESPTSSQVQPKKRNLRQERMKFFEENYEKGIWRKPPGAKKKSSIQPKR